MLGSNLDNAHPYGIHIAIGGGTAPPEVGEAAERAAGKADRLLARLTAKEPARRRTAPARRRTARQQRQRTASGQ